MALKNFVNFWERVGIAEEPLHNFVVLPRTQQARLAQHEMDPSDWAFVRLGELPNQQAFIQIPNGNGAFGVGTGQSVHIVGSAE